MVEIMKKEFCEFCMKDTECKYNERIKEEVIDKDRIRYLEKYYVCSECNNELYGDLLDDNIIAANNELRKIHNIITISEIEKIIEKYHIGKKPLSLILGLGEVNIIRYLNGTNPTKEISDLLKSILNNPFLFELFLNANKDKISNVAYKKSLGKTKQLELTNQKSKLYNVCLYIINKLVEVDQLSVQKILFFANGFSKSFLGNNLFSDCPEAWVHGPVYREIYDSLSYYKSNKIDYNELLFDREFSLSDEETKYLDVILESFGSYSGSILREMTHLTSPWINTRIGLDINESSCRRIDLEEMNDYFENIYKEYKMHDFIDIFKYSDRLFNEARKVKFENNN